MTEDTKQITADNLRADFLNATTNWQRWNVLNRALDWAVAASENADAYRQKAEELNTAAEGKRNDVFGLAVEDKTVFAGDIVTWDGDEKGWIVRAVRPHGGMVEIVPLGDDWELGRTLVQAEELL